MPSAYNLPEETASLRLRRLLQARAPEDASAPADPPTAPQGDDAPIVLSPKGSLTADEQPGEAESTTPSLPPRRLRSYFEAPGPAVPTDFHFGDILALDNAAIVIYRQPVPNRGYDFVYELGDGGALAARGVKLADHEPRRLGRLEGDLCHKMIQAKAWERDAIVYHLEHWTMGSFIPMTDGSRLVAAHHIEPVAVPVESSAAPSAVEDSAETQSAPESAPAAPPGNKQPSRRGTKLRVTMGEKSWEALYWGEDQRGTVVAHQTEGLWYLIHLDLLRFGDNLNVGETLDADEIDRIAQQIRTLPSAANG